MRYFLCRGVGPNCGHVAGANPSVHRHAANLGSFLSLHGDKGMDGNLNGNGRNGALEDSDLKLEWTKWNGMDRNGGMEGMV